MELKLFPELVMEKKLFPELVPEREAGWWVMSEDLPLKTVSGKSATNPTQAGGSCYKIFLWRSFQVSYQHNPAESCNVGNKWLSYSNQFVRNMFWAMLQPVRR